MVKWIYYINCADNRRSRKKNYEIGKSYTSTAPIDIRLWTSIVTFECKRLCLTMLNCNSMIHQYIVCILKKNLSRYIFAYLTIIFLNYNKIIIVILCLNINFLMLKYSLKGVKYTKIRFIKYIKCQVPIVIVFEL